MKSNAIRNHMLLACIAVAAWAMPATAQQYRGIWVDAFHSGYKSSSQINTLVARAVEGNYNMIFPEVLAYQDYSSRYSGHGAFWNSNIVPKTDDVSSSFDPLAYLVSRAHQYGIEVHCWLVPFRVSTSWPPSGNSTLINHPEWIMVPEGNMGTISKISDYYFLDPGSPDVQQYLIDIVMELVENYDIDGIHYDYIRYVDKNAGYPSSTTYENSGLARYQRIYDTTSVPPYSGNGNWNDFRRRSINELVARTRAEIGKYDSDNGTDTCFSAALITWGNAPSNFHYSSAYGLFSDWEYWLSQGWLDLGCPMSYYDHRNHATYFQNWTNNCQTWKHSRHMAMGPALYLNSKANSIIQIQYALNAGSEGVLNYNYVGTADENNDGTWESDWTWYSYVASNVFTSAVDTPDHPWRDPAQATEGTLFGQVTIADELVDNARVFVPGVGDFYTDANGYYVATLISPGTIPVTAYVGSDSQTVSNVTVEAGVTKRVDIAFARGDVDGDGDIDMDDFISVRTKLNLPAHFLQAWDVDNNGVIDLVDMTITRNGMSSK